MLLDYSKIFICLILALIMACEADSPEPDNILKLRPLTYEEETLLNSSNEFSFELLRMLNLKNPGENVIFSSFGVGNGIGMAFNIIEEKPKEELKNFLKISDVGDIEIHKAYFQLGEILNLIDRDVQFTKANSLWINNTQELNQLSSDKIMAYYDADVEYLNFNNDKSIRTINRWIENRSYGRIDHVINQIYPDDRSYIINAIHFDVHWNLPFNELTLENFEFTDLNGDRRPCNQINLFSGEYMIYRDNNIILVDIPLGNKQFYLSIILPSRILDFYKVVQKIDPKMVDELLENSVTVKNDIFLPKININSEVRLKSLFPQFGLTGPIEVIENYYPVNDLFISDFIHKTTINIGNKSKSDRKKSDAQIIQMTSSNPLIIDRPFIFLVREKYTGAFVFTGQLVEPAP